MKKNFSIKQIVGSVITAICVILCFYIAIEVIVSSKSKRPPSVFGISVSYVPTESMEPNIHAGDYVLFTKVDFNDVKVGDVIVYRNNQDMFIIHRVIENHGDYLITKGDNNLLPDDIHVTKDILFGKYSHTIGFMKIFGGGVSKNMVFGILIALFAGVVVLQVVQLAIKAKTEEIKKKNDLDRKALLEQMKQEILAEELAKIKEEQKSKEQE